VHYLSCNATSYTVNQYPSDNGTCTGSPTTKTFPLSNWNGTGAGGSGPFDLGPWAGYLCAACYVPDFTTPVYLASTLTLSGYTVATFGTVQAASFCAAVVTATGAVTCIVTSVTAPPSRHLLVASVSVGYSVLTHPSSQASVAAIMSNPSGALASPATFQAAGLSAVTTAAPSSVAPASGSLPAAAPLPNTSPSSGAAPASAAIASLVAVLAVASMLA